MTGCESPFEDSKKVGRLQEQNYKLQTAAMEKSRSYEESLGKVNASVNALYDQSVLLTNQVNEMKQTVAALQQRNAKLEQDLASMKTQVDAVRQAQETSVKKMSDTLAKETANAINAREKNSQAELAKLQQSLAQTQQSLNQTQQAWAQAQQQAAAAAKAQKSAPAATGGSFYEYTVQPGASLSAIASAYKVSPQDIIKANNLKNSNISVGQKLLIPKK
jgi:LysM repeat protein